MRNKHVQFQQKKNKAPFVIECLMDDMIDCVKMNLVDFFNKNNIFHPICVDLRFEDQIEIVKDFNYVNEDNDAQLGNHIVAFNKKNMKFRYGKYIKNIDNNTYILRNKYRGIQVIRNEYYIFEKKYKNKNNKLRDCLENILNGTIKIKKNI